MSHPTEPSDPNRPGPAYPGDAHPGDTRPGDAPSAYPPGPAHGGAYPPPASPYGQGYPAPVAPRNGLGTAALVVGVLALLFAVLFFPLGLILAIVAIILGVLGRKRAKRGEATNGGMALAGLILGIVALLLAVLLGVIAGAVLNKVKDCADPSLSAQEQQTCVEDKITNSG